MSLFFNAHVCVFAVSFAACGSQARRERGLGRLCGLEARPERVQVAPRLRGCDPC